MLFSDRGNSTFSGLWKTRYFDYKRMQMDCTYYVDYTIAKKEGATITVLLAKIQTTATFIGLREYETKDINTQ